MRVVFVLVLTGVPVAQIDGATQWILALAVGLFIYVALSNVVRNCLTTTFVLRKESFRNFSGLIR